MEVRLIAQTSFDFPAVGGLIGWSEQPPTNQRPSYADMLAEFAGRSCYQSWNRPNEKTAMNDDYLAHITEVGHFSVLEHASATFYVTGVSRSLTHELIRHRHLSYSQLSQRFVKMASDQMVNPPALRELMDKEHTSLTPQERQVVNTIERSRVAAQEAYWSIDDYLSHTKKKSRKESREAARSVLPNATETRIVVTGNMRAWREFMPKRFDMTADAEIREFAEIVLKHLRSIAPNTFADIPEEPYGS
jgi:thymidylate synthase (FAD)